VLERSASGGGKLRLLSPAHAWLLNTSFGNVRKIRERLGAATIALHPLDAAERSLADGDTALVHNDCGRLELKVVMTSDEVPRGVALAHKGRWLATDLKHANVNVLNPGYKSDMGESTAVHGVEVLVHGVVPRTGRCRASRRGAGRRRPMNAREGGAVGLKRSLTYWDLVLYGLAYIAPFAPLSTLGFVWNESNGLIVLAYVLGGVCMYFTAQSYATMTELLPTAGSVYGFARYCLGKFLGFMAGWMILLDYLLIPAFVYVLIAVALETLLPGVDRGVWILLLATATTAVNWFGITVTSRANFVSVALQVIILLGFMVLGLIALYAGKGDGALTLKPLFDAATFQRRQDFQRHLDLHHVVPGIRCGLDARRRSAGGRPAGGR
jgi:hypothetical protein